MGLIVALVGLPLLSWAFRAVAGEIHDAWHVVLRELLNFGLAAFLCWIAFGMERTSGLSVGWRGRHLLRSMAWGLLLGILALALTIVLYLYLQLFGVQHRCRAGAPVRATAQGRGWAGAG